MFGRIPRSVSPKGGDRAELGVRYLFGFDQAVFSREIQVSLTGHDERLRRDGGESLVEVPAKHAVVTDVGMQPRLQHGKQVPGVPTQKTGFPVAYQKILQRGKTQTEIDVFAIEGL